MHSAEWTTTANKSGLSGASAASTLAQPYSARCIHHSACLVPACPNGRWYVPVSLGRQPPVATGLLADGAAGTADMLPTFSSILLLVPHHSLERVHEHHVPHPLARARRPGLRRSGGRR